MYFVQLVSHFYYTLIWSALHVFNSVPILFPRLRERQLLDRRRVEDAYYQYAGVKVCHWYPDTFCLANLPLHAEISETLPMMTKVYHGLFMKCYSSTYDFCVCTYTCYRSL